MLQKLERLCNRFSDLLGRISALLFLLLVLNVFYDVVARYLFNSVSIGLQELEWHLYASIFLLGIPYAIRTDSHVRVDIIYDRLGARRKALIDLCGVIFLLLPFVLLVAWYGSSFAFESWSLGERSGDPGGLPYRWVIKAVIPFACLSMAVAGVGMLLRSLNTLRDMMPPDETGAA
ncbi:C4-dicarboxylate ABC transporter [Solemya velum gill symbiont]|uniref:TRAP transporter small permease protein n=1 Tax=Solemya velum gill symbiont TaxID=2340 RepID=A0A1T2E143_SOVGS|nr:TRAP transporter small permease subunit [Solemya velum gill symbiont]OOY36132.1 C4-dicarboxylate ABC transporter [Solemya velum gill symbiont]OOY38162.1 C4-dicarboxylate ABC transporter [Solemya velum gill symbiont]OOY38977.1 C4-dicarboxylate ABC transporter [Solemya velum gill symbiont]OOY43855.1 C4-dicarboxylate ABC transporter [Solemya velum gill symbiont]OOY45082.1 C4-dicarboxylate ABC transporter [Solemya velum gill symbiont]